MLMVLISVGKHIICLSMNWTVQQVLFLFSLEFKKWMKKGKVYKRLLAGTLTHIHTETHLHQQHAQNRYHNGTNLLLIFFRRKWILKAYQKFNDAMHVCVCVICLEFRSWIDYLILFEVKTGTLLNCFRETTTNFILINIFVVLYW